MIPTRFQPLLDETESLSAAFQAAGRRLYLVGGVVRDTLLGRAHADTDTDIDLTTDATPEQTLAIVKPLRPNAVWTQGQRFGTIGVKFGERLVEITTHRAEAYSEDSRKPDVQFSTDVTTDLSRRDFTINAMALSLPDMTLIDPFDGVGDLAAKRLRTPLDPTVSFGDDPLRMLRAARFISGFSMEPDEALVAAVRAMSGRLSIVSAERIHAELDKLLVVDSPSAGLWFLVDTGLAAQFLPELPAMALEQDPIHRHKDVLAHTIAVVEKTSPNKVLRLAALLHDIAKPRTRRISDGGVTFYHHDVVGARMTRERMKQLKYSTEDIDDVSELVALHLRFHTYASGWTDAAVRRYVRDAGHLLDQLNELTRCDCTTRNARKAAILGKRMDDLEVRIAELREQEELDAIRPDLDGRQVMDLLGIPAGRAIGEALEMLLQARLDEGPSSPEQAEQRLRQWWSEHNH